MTVSSLIVRAGFEAVRALAHMDLDAFAARDCNHSAVSEPSKPQLCAELKLDPRHDRVVGEPLTKVMAR